MFCPAEHAADAGSHGAFGIARFFNNTDAQGTHRISDLDGRNVAVAAFGHPSAHRRVEGHINNAVSDLQAGPRGVLRISATAGFAEACVADKLPEFAAAHPEFEVRFGASERVIDLTEENVDVAIRIGELPDSRLVARHLDQGEFLLCGSRSYIQDWGQPERIRDLSRHRCIRYGTPGWDRWHVVESKRRRTVEVSGNLVFDHVASLVRAVRAGGGLSLLPRWAVAEQLRAGDLVSVLDKMRWTPYSGKDTGVYVLFLERRHLAPKIRVFAEFLRRTFAG